MRRLVVVVALLGAVALAGCSSEAHTPSRPSAGASPTPTTSAATGPLSVFVYGDERKISAYRRIADGFARTDGGVKVQLHVYADAQRAADATLTGLRGKFGPDVFLLDQTYLPEFVDPPLLTPLDEPLEKRGLQFGDDYQRVALTAMSADAALQCMPAEVSPLVVYYNRDLLPRRQLAAAGVTLPHSADTWTWDDFAATARAMAGRDHLGPVKGVSIPSDLDVLTAFLRSAGADVVDDDVNPTKLDLESDTAVETIRKVALLARDPSVSLTAAQLQEKTPEQWFTEGRLGMFLGTREDLPALRDTPGLRFDVAPLPSFGSPRTVSQINGWCVNASSQHVDEAADFIAYAVSRKASRLAASTDVIVPSRLDVVSSRLFLEPDEQPRDSQVFVNSIRRSDPLPFAKQWPAVEQSAKVELEQLFTNPFIDLDSMLTKRLARLDAKSAEELAPETPQ